MTAFQIDGLRFFKFFALPCYLIFVADSCIVNALRSFSHVILICLLATLTDSVWIEWVVDGLKVAFCGYFQISWLGTAAFSRLVCERLLRLIFE